MKFYILTRYQLNEETDKFQQVPAEAYECTNRLNNNIQ